MATQVVAPLGTNPNFTLNEWLQMAATNNIDDTVIYEYLSPPLPSDLVSRWLQRIDRIENAKKPAKVTAASWQGKKSAMKGHAFERLITSILGTVRFFQAWRNVGTTTNEIDVLVEVGMGCQISPVIRQWGPHFICECKLVAGSINATWIGKLNTVLKLHNASVGILVASKGPPKGKVKTQIHMLTLTTPPSTIVCISLADLQDCQNGGCFLRLLATRYLQVRTGAAALLAG